MRIKVVSMPIDRSVFWKRIGVGILAIWLLTGVLWFSLWNYYATTKPREIQAERGRLIPLSSHGIVVYLTQEEARNLKLLNYGVYVCTFAFVFFYLFKRPFGDRH
jgi:hypothetical protein